MISSPSPARLLDEACKILFGDQTSNPVFNFPINISDLEQSTAEDELLPAPPFIPSRTHTDSRSKSWFTYALNEGAWKVESCLLQTLKEIVLEAQDAKAKGKPSLSDAITFVIAGQRDARYMRIITKFGPTTARFLRKKRKTLLLAGGNWKESCLNYKADRRQVDKQHTLQVDM